jgi:uncharacterized protein (DUF342 family)
VRINTGLVRCETAAGGTVTVGGGLVGGRVVATSDVAASCIGSPSGTPTRVEISPDRRYRGRILELNQQVTEVKEELARLERAAFRNMRYSNPLEGSPGSQGDSPELAHLREERDMKASELDRIVIERDRLKRLCTEMKERGCVTATEVIHPGVRVMLGDARAETVAPSPGTRVSIGRGGTKLVFESIRGPE